MPKITVSHSLFNIQISLTTTERPSVLEIGLAWIQAGPRLLEAVIEATTMNELTEVIDEEMIYYNVERRHSSLGNISPMLYLESEGISVENITLNWV